MREITAVEAIHQIAGARLPSDIFAGDPAAAADARRARRTYRAMVALIHPDIADARGIELGDAQASTAKLNELYEQWQHGNTKPTAIAAPHVVGAHGTYLLHTRVHQAPQVSTYDTDKPGLRVAISRTNTTAVTSLIAAAGQLTAGGLSPFGPEIIDTGVVDGRTWSAYRLPEGLHTLREVRAAYPAGLDGRDWAWMARRILIAIGAAGQPNGDVNQDTVLIHPEQHGVVLTGWGGQTVDPLIADKCDHLDGEDLAGLFDTMLAATETRQRHFARGATTLPPKRWLAEYDLLLRQLYGDRRYRPFSLPRTA